MERHTDGFFGVNEALFSSALAAIVFSTLAAQPLTIVGITGLISLFNYTIYDIAVRQGIGNLYPEFLAWVSIWAAITHWIASFGNLCDYMRFITDFSSNAFGMYVGIIYMSMSSGLVSSGMMMLTILQSRVYKNSSLSSLRAHMRQAS